MGHDAHDPGLDRLIRAIGFGTEHTDLDPVRIRQRLAAPVRTRRPTAAERAHLTARLGWSWDGIA